MVHIHVPGVVCRCNWVASRFDYSVRYGGVGDPPKESSHLGYCTQICYFVRNERIGQIWVPAYRLTTHYDQVRTAKCIKMNNFDTHYLTNHLQSHESTNSNRLSFPLSNLRRKLSFVCWAVFYLPNKPTLNILLLQVASIEYPGLSMTDSQVLDFEVHTTVRQATNNIHKLKGDLVKVRIPVTGILSRSATISKHLTCAALVERLKRLNYVLSHDKQYIILDLGNIRGSPK